MIFSKKGILVTGSSGFIGSKLIENIPYDSLITCPRGKNEKYFYKNDYFDKNILSEFEDLRVVHLATFFSTKKIKIGFIKPIYLLVRQYLMI